jgi:hypothetical protein
MDDIAEFLPIKLSPGFIAVAFHLGCIGCNFCSVRYGNSRDQLFAARVHRTYPTTPAEIVDLLRAMPSYAKARVPIRLGNDTDLRFEMDEVVEFLDLLPADYPACALTRFPISERHAARLSRPNVIVKLTATPASAFLECPDNAAEVIASAAWFDTPVVVTLGPVTANNFAECRRLLDAIPRKPNITVYVKPLNDEFHPSLRSIPQITAEQYAELRQEITDRNFRHLSQLMCPVNEKLGLAHKRVSDVPEDERAHCERCASRDLCHVPEEVTVSSIRTVMASLGLTPVSVTRKAFKSYVVAVDAASGYGDEAYLSEILGCKVKLTGTAAGTGGGAYAASREVLDRWQRVGFFPYTRLIQRVRQFIEESVHAEHHGTVEDRLG